MKSPREDNVDSGASASVNTNSPNAPARSPLYLCSGSRLRDGIYDWRGITPQPVQRAVEALRKSFEKQAWKIDQIMKKGCYPALHKGSSEEARKISRHIEQQMGYPAFPTVDEGETEPAVFCSYFYRCADLLAGDLRRTFSDLRDIGLVQSALLNRPPVDWAAIQARVLVADLSYKIVL